VSSRHAKQEERRWRIAGFLKTSKNTFPLLIILLDQFLKSLGKGLEHFIDKSKSGRLLLVCILLEF